MNHISVHEALLDNMNEIYQSIEHEQVEEEIFVPVTVALTATYAEVLSSFYNQEADLYDGDLSEFSGAWRFK